MQHESDTWPANGCRYDLTVLENGWVVHTAVMCACRMARVEHNM